MFSAAREDALFFVHKFGVQKHRLEELRLVNICVNFPHAQSFADFMEFFSSLISIMSTGKEQTIDSQHLFIYFQLF